jgi:hypothetical protein
MTNQAPNPAVLSRLYLSAVLPCLTDLAEQDPAARAIIGDAHASIALRILGGPAATLKLKQGKIDWHNGSIGWPSVTLLFFSERHLNAFFAGNKLAVPLPVWGGWRIGLLARFSKLAAMLEATLNGEPSVLATPRGRRLHTRLTLIAAGLGLSSLAQGDAVAMHSAAGPCRLHHSGRTRINRMVRPRLPGTNHRVERTATAPRRTYRVSRHGRGLCSDAR